MKVALFTQRLTSDWMKRQSLAQVFLHFALSDRSHSSQKRSLSLHLLSVGLRFIFTCFSVWTRAKCALPENRFQKSVTRWKDRQRVSQRYRQWLNEQQRADHLFINGLRLWLQWIAGIIRGLVDVRKRLAWAAHWGEWSKRCTFFFTLSSV